MDSRRVKTPLINLEVEYRGETARVGFSSCYYARAKNSVTFVTFADLRVAPEQAGLESHFASESDFPRGWIPAGKTGRREEGPGQKWQDKAPGAEESDKVDKGDKSVILDGFRDKSDDSDRFAQSRHFQWRRAGVLARLSTRDSSRFLQTPACEP